MTRVLRMFIGSKRYIIKIYTIITLKFLLIDVIFLYVMHACLQHSHKNFFFTTNLPESFVLK
jgi:hypothetical protein